MSIFEFSDYKEFIKLQIERQLYTPSGRKKSNLSVLAKKLGYSSPSSLSMIVSGKRIPTDEICENMSAIWGLSLRERQYFRLLVQLQRKKQMGEDPAPVVVLLQKLVSKFEAPLFTDNDCIHVREWHYLVIKHMMEMKSFREDPLWISSTLKKKITPAQVERTLDKLQEIGLIERDPQTKKLRPRHLSMQSTTDIPSAAIRAHHQQMLSRAIEAIEEIPADQRVFNSMTFNIEKSKLQQLRKQVSDFVDQIHNEYASTNADAVFQLNLQLFEHTVSGMEPKKGVV